MKPKQLRKQHEVFTQTLNVAEPRARSPQRPLTLTLSPAYRGEGTKPTSWTGSLRIVFAILLSLLGNFSDYAQAAGPAVHIVVGERAEPLEKLAAEEMSGQLKKQFDAEVTIANAAPPDAANVIYLGTKESCPIWDRINAPNVPSPGYILKSITVEDKLAVLVLGDQPETVLQAAYGLGYYFGIRAFRFGDLHPITRPNFSLEGIDVIEQVKFAEQAWNGDYASPFGLDALTVEEIESLFRQLSKLRFRSVFWNGAVSTRRPLGGVRFRVDGDTAGRTAFKGEKLFRNPDFDLVDSASEAERVAEAFREHVLNQAEKFGIRIQFHNVPKESTVLPTWYEWSELFQNRTPSPPETLADIPEAYLGPVLGDGVSERCEKAFTMCLAVIDTENRAGTKKRDQFTDGLPPGCMSLGLPNEKMLVFAYDSTEPPPAWWGEVRTHYLNAMNEMYRANTRAREGGRAFTLYYARRFEFGFEYMNAVEALRKAAIAKQAGKKDEQIAELEKSLDSITACCNAMAAVSRSNSDRGIIAVMNEYGYRPVTKLLEAADAGN